MVIRKHQELLQAAREEQRQVLAEIRLRYLEALLEYNELGGNADLKQQVMDVVRSYAKGIPLPLLTNVFTDQAALRKAREELVKEGELSETKSGASLVLKAVATEQAEPKEQVGENESSGDEGVNEESAPAAPPATQPTKTAPRKP